MGRYLICGLSGTGKTTVAKNLAKRGFATVNMDDPETVISFYREAKTSKYIERPMPPFTENWLRRHEWVWDDRRVREILASHSDIFLCGDATNEADLYPLFDKVFGLYIASEPEIIRRLQKREPKRWADGSPDLDAKLKRNRHELHRLQGAGAVLINADQPPGRVVGDILRHIP